MERYNGWSNYATWRVNLEISDDLIQGIREDGTTFDSVLSLEETLRDQVDEALTNYGDVPDCIALDYARSFVSDVDFREIAEHAVANYPELVATEEDEEEDAS